MAVSEACLLSQNLSIFFHTFELDENSFWGGSGDQDLVDEMVDDMLSEMNGMYYESVKRAIADYVLLNENERERLNVAITPHESAVHRRIEFMFGETYVTFLKKLGNLPFAFFFHPSLPKI